MKKTIPIILALLITLLFARAEVEIEPERQYTIKTHLVKIIPAIGDFRVMQGGCVSGKYAWFALVEWGKSFSDSDRRTIILKYDRESMTEVQRSEPLTLNHANDITYLPETNELYVINGFRNCISVIDAVDLTLKDIKQIKYSNGYALDYCVEKETFVMAVDKCDARYFDKELNKMTKYVFTEYTTLTTQGICSTENYIYHVLFSYQNKEEQDNMIWIADWGGKIVAKLPLDVGGFEPENISLVENTFYIGCNSGTGGAVYTAELIKMEDIN